MILYAHPNGQCDFRAPPRVAVGVMHAIVNGRIHFTPGWPLDRIKAIEPFSYQQPQLTDGRTQIGETGE